MQTLLDTLVLGGRESGEIFSFNLQHQVPKFVCICFPHFCIKMGKVISTQPFLRDTIHVAGGDTLKPTWVDSEKPEANSASVTSHNKLLLQGLGGFLRGLQSWDQGHRKQPISGSRREEGEERPASWWCQRGEAGRGSRGLTPGRAGSPLLCLSYKIVNEKNGQ